MSDLVTLVHTFNGSWQSLSQTGKATRISFQADGANANPCYIAGNSPTPTDEYGERIPAPVDSEPAAPLVYGELTGQGQYELGKFRVKGTNAEKLRLNIYTYP